MFAMVAERVRLVDTVHLGRLLAEGACVFEGAQGVLLDEWRGFHPYTTWSTTTFDNAAELIGDDPVPARACCAASPPGTARGRWSPRTPA